MAIVTPTTELEAVNRILATISETPVATLEDDTVVDAAMARDTLRAEMRALQMKGWHWNTDYEYTLVPDSNDEIRIPPNCAFLDPSPSSGKDYVWRGTRLYDTKNHTYKITEPVKVDIVWFLEFEEMPEAARYYCLSRAARKFHDNQMGDGELHQFTKEDEDAAFKLLKDAEAKIVDANMLSDSWTVRRVIARRSPWRV